MRYNLIISSDWLLDVRILGLQWVWRVRYVYTLLVNSTVPCFCEMNVSLHKKYITFGMVKFLLLHSLCTAAISVVAVTGGTEVRRSLERFLASSLNTLTPDISTNPATWNAPGKDFSARGLSTGSYSETNSFQAFDKFSFTFSHNSGIAEGDGKSLAKGLCWVYSLGSLILSLCPTCSIRRRSPMLMDRFPERRRWWTRTKT